MPSRNRVKSYVAGGYYHVYSRGNEKQLIFKAEEDYKYFLGLLKRYLSPDKSMDSQYRVYGKLSDEVDLISYCLMPNHFHLLLLQTPEDGMRKLLHRILTAYVMYFNNKYERTGTLFHDRYKAAHVKDDTYLAHVSRYIHLNPDGYESYLYSSYGDFTGRRKSAWVKPRVILSVLADSGETYADFAHSYREHKQALQEIKQFLAD